MSPLKCFVIMPFDSGFDPVFQTVQKAIQHAVAGVTIECEWLKDVHAPGRITYDIVDGILKAALCVSDLTGNNANVMWETGYAMALGRPTILIGQGVEGLPFDLKVHRVLPYRVGALSELEVKLGRATGETLARYDLKHSHQPPSPPRRHGPSIVVTGTSVADEARVGRRIETLLLPYLSADTAWYCGSIGTVDDAAVQFLLSHRQHVVIVGYHRFDLAGRTLELVEQDKVHFLDASVEALPRGLAGPSERDIVFAAKGDLVILLWDGKSRGTKELIGYFQSTARNVLIGYV